MSLLAVRCRTAIVPGLRYSFRKEGRNEGDRNNEWWETYHRLGWCIMKCNSEILHTTTDRLFISVMLIISIFFFVVWTPNSINSLSTRVLYHPSSYCAPRQYCRMLFVLYYVLFIHLRTSLFLLALSRVVALSMVVTMVVGWCSYCFVLCMSDLYLHSVMTCPFSSTMLSIFFFNFGFSC